jgi:hypothetical protein
MMLESGESTASCYSVVATLRTNAHPRQIKTSKEPHPVPEYETLLGIAPIMMGIVIAVPSVKRVFALARFDLLLVLHKL